MTIEFDSNIRGVDIVVSASGFFEELDTGINLHPENINAKTKNGREFILTLAEMDDLAIIATEMYYDRLNDDDWD